MSLSFFVCPQGTNISYTQEGGGRNIFDTQGGTNIFALRGGTNILTARWWTIIFTNWGGQTFYVGGSCGYDDVYGKMDVSEANICVSEASKSSAGARIFRGP